MVDVTFASWRDGTRARHWPALAPLTLVVTALHAALLLSWLPAPPERVGRGGGAPLFVRQWQVPTAPVVDPPPAQQGAPHEGPREKPHEMQPAVPRAARAPGGLQRAEDRRAAAISGNAPTPLSMRAGPVATARAAAPVVVAAANARGAQVPAPTAPDTSDAVGARAADGAAAVAAELEGAPAPVYPTRPPGTATLHYELRRGGAAGGAVLDWRRDGGRYALSLVGTIGGREVLGWSGRGGFDEAGLAPERFVVRRRGRELLAANFQRDLPTPDTVGAAARGRITFSGPSVEWPLLPGVQDRLSWLLQLASIVAADPSLGREGARVELWTVGARGDAERWALHGRAPQTLELPAGAVLDAPSFVREARRSYDARVEVWLDPARQYLPARLRFTSVPGGEVTELLLRAEPGR